MRKKLAFFLICFLFGCAITNTKSLDVGPFKIDVPNEWVSNVPQDQENSLVGSIKGEIL
jgi:hypothetical protein